MAGNTPRAITSRENHLPIVLFDSNSFHFLTFRGGPLIRAKVAWKSTTHSTEHYNTHLNYSPFTE